MAFGVGALTISALHAFKASRRAVCALRRSSNSMRYEKAIDGIKATLTTEPAPADAAYDESKFVLSSAEREEFESLLKAHVARVEALRACRAAPKPKPMASTPLEAEALALLEKQREGLSWSVSETDASGRPMPI